MSKFNTTEDQQSNMIKDPDDWKTGDEDMTGAQRSYLQTLARASARRGEAVTAEVMKKIQWLRPKLVAQIEFTDWTEGNHLRHSEFVALRNDKSAREVVKESAARSRAGRFLV